MGTAGRQRRRPASSRREDRYAPTRSVTCTPEIPKTRAVLPRSPRPTEPSAPISHR